MSQDPEVLADREPAGTLGRGVSGPLGRGRDHRARSWGRSPGRRRAIAGTREVSARGPQLGRAALADPTPSPGPAATGGMGPAALRNGAPCWRPGAAAPHPDPGLRPPSLTRGLGGPHPASQSGLAARGGVTLHPRSHRTEPGGRERRAVESSPPPSAPGPPPTPLSPPWAIASRHPLLARAEGPSPCGGQGPPAAHPASPYPVWAAGRQAGRGGSGQGPWLQSEGT